MIVQELIEHAKNVTGEFNLSKNSFRAGNVGAALLTSKGKIYTGICIDIACGIGFCAEHAAIAEMLKHRETEIEMIVAVSRKGILPPCGRCRELMHQINHKNINTKVIISADKIITLDELLPYRFL